MSESFQNYSAVVILLYVILCYYMVVYCAIVWNSFKKNLFTAVKSNLLKLSILCTVTLKEKALIHDFLI